MRKQTAIKHLLILSMSLALLLITGSALAQTFTWTTTGSLNTARYFHTASVLTDGRVLAAGGVDTSGFASNSAEIFDPATGLWTATGSLNTAPLPHRQRADRRAHPGGR